LRLSKIQPKNLEKLKINNQQKIESISRETYELYSKRVVQTKRIGTLSRKMTSFHQSENFILLIGLELGLELF